MSFTSWLAFFHRPSRHPIRKAIRRHTSPTSTSRLGVEQLEDRLTPAISTEVTVVLNPTVQVTHHPQGGRVRNSARLVSVESLSNTTLLLKFNTKLGRNARNIDAYEVEGLTILGVEVLKGRKSVLLTTSPQENRAYAVELNNLWSRDRVRITKTRMVMGAPPEIPPSIGNPGNQSGNEGALVQLQVPFLGLSGVPLTFNALGLPPGLTMNDETGVISGILGKQAANGSPHTVAVTVSDSFFTTPPQLFTWTVRDLTTPVVSIPNQRNNEGQTLSFDLNTFGTDADGDPLTFTVTGTLPPGLSFNRLTGRIVGTIGNQAVVGSPYTVTVTASDSNNTSAASTFTWTVNDITTPTINVPAQANAERQTVAVDLHAFASDPGGDPLTFTVSGSLPPGLAFNNLTGLISGTLGNQSAGAYPLTVAVSDGVNTSTAHSFTWTITDTTTPVLNVPNQTSLATTVDLRNFVTNVDADSLTFAIHGQLPPGFTFNSSTGVIGLSANAPAPGIYVLAVTASDGNNTSTPQTFTWTIIDTTAPTINVPNQSNAEGQTVQFNLHDFASDPGGQVLTFTVTGTLPPGLRLNSQTGVISGTLGGQSRGTYALGVTASDGVNTSSSSSFTWTITDATTPTINVPNRSNPAGEAVTLDLNHFASDTDGDALTFTVTGTLPPGLTFNNLTGVISGTLGDKTTAGTYPLSVVASDGVNASSARSFTWTVVDTSPPVINVPNQTSQEGQSVTLNLNDFVTNAAGDTLTFTVNNPLPGGFSFNGNTGVINLNAGGQSAGTYAFSVAVTDGTYASAPQTFTWTINDTTTPTINVPNQTNRVGEAVTLDLHNFANDSEGDPLTFTVSGQLPPGLSFNGSTGIISGTPLNVLATYSLGVTVSDGSNRSSTHNFQWTIDVPLPVSDTTPPRATGAASLSNTTVLVAFSEAMADNVLIAAHYVIVQQNVNSEVGFVAVLNVVFNSADRRSVLLTTASQNEVTYSVTVVNVTDLAGNSMAQPVFVGGVRVDPSAAIFPGTPPSGAQNVDTDRDGLTDAAESRGYTITVTLLDGTRVGRQVTSDPALADTDGDGLSDAQEVNIGTSARAADTDGDQLNDYVEFNEIYSDPTRQDTDGDSLDDSLEFNFFRTSPIFADTDGDQLRDDAEIFSSIRNPVVADLPAPDIEVGNIDLRLDVRFTETTSTGRRELESRSVSSTLEQTSNNSYSHTDSGTLEASASYSQEWGYSSDNLGIPEVTIGVEASTSGSWTTESSRESSQETKQAYSDSLQTDVETTENGEVVREVVGARMQIALTLKSTGTIAFRVKNLLVTALFQDPQDPANLRPIASLTPDFEPADGFAVGPLVPERGPLILSSNTVFPSMIESLMQNPRGLVFRIANYDIIDELGRNFAFTSQDIVERTGLVVFDFGGEDSDANGEGDLAEYHRAAANTGRVIDTNFDGVVDADDNRAIFDAAGKPVGITLRDAFAAMGLKHYIAKLDATAPQGYREYEEDGTTPANLDSLDKIRGSYSTIINDNGVEQIFRIRDTANSNTLRKAWYMILPQGDLDSVTNFNDRVLQAGSRIRLAYVQDLDGDNLPATLEYLLGTVDSSTDVFNNTTWAAGADGVPDSVDTDKDGLPDRIETLIGWTVDLGGRGTRRVTSSGSVADTDNDGVNDAFEAPALSAFEDLNGDSLVDRFNSGLVNYAAEFVTDPANPDTDGDSVARYIYRAPGENTRGLRDDFVEIFGDGLSANPTPDVPIPNVRTGGPYRVERLFTGGGIFSTRSSPTLADTDGDGLADGVEVRFGLNPYVAGDRDSDRDGLPDLVETAGWDVVYRSVSTAPNQQGAAVMVHVTSDPFVADTDADGLSDFLEFDISSGASAQPVHSDPTRADSDRDGLTDRQEILGIVVRDLGIITLDPLDADTDNDLRSDSDEAELVDVERMRWFVVTEGKAPYRVFSDPRIADADVDGLVDGEEYGDFTGDGLLDPRDFYHGDGRNDVGLFRTDPTNNNTDADKRNDGVEIRGGVNPLIEDLRVTVVASYVVFTADGEGGGPGEITTKLQVRLPSESGVAGLSDTVIDVVNRFAILNDVGPNAGVDDRYYFSQSPFGLPIGSRSFSFSLGKNQRFSIEGSIREFDAPGSYFEFALGGLEGIRAVQTQLADNADPNPPTDPKEWTRTVFSYTDVASQSIQEYFFQFDSDDYPFTQVGSNDRLAGELGFYYIIE